MPSLRTLTILFLAAFGSVTLLTGWLTYAATRGAIVGLVDDRIDAMGDAILIGVAPGDARAILARIAAVSHSRESGDVGFQLADRDGRRLGGNVTLAEALPPGFSTVHPRHGIAGLSTGRAEVRAAGLLMLSQKNIFCLEK